MFGRYPQRLLGEPGERGPRHRSIASPTSANRLLHKVIDLDRMSDIAHSLISTLEWPVSARLPSSLV